MPIDVEATSTGKTGNAGIARFRPLHPRGWPTALWHRNCSALEESKAELKPDKPARGGTFRRSAFPRKETP